MLRRLFGAARSPARGRAGIPPGQRVYAVGDIHGRLDLLDDLLGQVERDVAAAAPGTAATLVFLGDLVDRGPDSAGVVDRLATHAAPVAAVRFLTGNHEEIFLAALAGDDKALRLFCRIGGRETMTSYGLDPDAYERLDYAELHARMVALVPAAHQAFLAGFEEMVTIGDYAFVHAGVRPGIAFDEQVPADLRWIRRPFLDHRAPLERMVVHGHTIEPAVTFRPHRIGIDTGAYETGVLTALVLEGEDTRLLQTGG